MFSQYIERFESLTSREKIMVAAAFAAILWGGLNKLIIQPNLIRQNQLTQELASLQSQLSSTQQAEDHLLNNSQVDPNQLNRENLNDFKIRFEQQLNKIKIGNKRFVSPQLMAKALRDVLLQNYQLKLVKLDTLPASPLTGTAQSYAVYQHGLAITFSGRYFDTLEYLQSLEALPWRFYWDSIAYKVKEYPDAEITIKVYTLSFEKDWLSV